MPKDEELYAALVDGDVRGAIGETVALLAGGDVVALEDTWIAALAGVGERAPSGLWGAVAEALRDDLCASGDAIAVRDALRASVSLALLFRRAAAAGKRRRERLGVPELRERVAADFPDGAALSPSGARQFARLLEGMTETERAFAQRLLAGLCRLWGERDADGARAAMEYLTRRRLLALPVLAEWAVSRDEGDRGDVAWFLWGALRARFADRDDVRALWELYAWNWRRGVKTDRLGLLWGAGALVAAGRGRGGADGAAGGAAEAAEWAWNASERETLQKAADNAAEIWKHLAPEAAARALGGAVGAGGAVGGGGGGAADGPDGGARRARGRMGPAAADARDDENVARMNLWMSYLPRASAVGAASLPAPTPAAAAGPPASKALKIKGAPHGSSTPAAGAGSGGAAFAIAKRGGGYGSDGDGGGDDGDDAPGRADPWHRRLRAREAGPAAQALLPTKAHRQPMDQPDAVQPAQRARVEARHGLWRAPRPGDRPYPRV